MAKILSALVLVLLVAGCVAPGALPVQVSSTPVTPGGVLAATVVRATEPLPEATAATALTLPATVAVATASAGASVSPTSVVNPAPATPATPTPRPASSASLPDFGHIFIIMLENREAGDVMNSDTAPYLNSLAQRYATAADYYGISHPSLPNYLALTGGSTFDITSDCTDCFVAGDNLASQLQAAGRSWKAYMEAMPTPCYVGNDGTYAQRHNPFIYYDVVRTDPAQCARIVPFTQFAVDLKANALPDFVWITPDLCHDLHDCKNQVGDAWLKTWVPQILASPAWQNRGVLFILFDEGSSNEGCCSYASGGKIATLVVSPLVRPGFASQVAYDHYSLLRTIEEAWGLPLLGYAKDASTQSMTDFFAGQ